VAGTAAGARLTQAHRVAQLGIRAAFLRELLALWPMIDVTRLDETAADWIARVVDLITGYRAESAARALTYYEAFRKTETGAVLEHRELYRTLGVGNHAAIRTSLLVTGPIGVKSRIAKGIMPRQAVRQALVDVSGAASRHVLDGGRQLLANTVEKDATAVGWARVTGPHPCAFCALLASRGPVYKSARTASVSKSGERYHDHCACATEPFFDRSADWPDRSREYEQLYRESTANAYGAGKLRAFRKAFDAQHGQS
jgi:hypothetical protein